MLKRLEIEKKHTKVIFKRDPIPEVQIAVPREEGTFIVFSITPDQAVELSESLIELCRNHYIF